MDCRRTGTAVAPEDYRSRETCFVTRIEQDRRIPMRTMHFAFVLLTGGLAAISPTATADMYKWVDETGKVNYSDTPPRAADAKKVKASPALRVSPECATTGCYQAEARREEQKYRHEVALMNAQTYSKQVESERAARRAAATEAAANQRAARHDRLARRCAAERLVDCNQESTLQRLEDQDRPYNGARRVVRSTTP